MSVAKVNLGLTLNLGNYESFRIDIGVETEPRPGETMSDAIDRVYALVEAKVEEKKNEALEEING